MTSKLDKIMMLQEIREEFSEAYDESLIRQISGNEAKWEALELLGEGTYFEARGLGSLAVKMLIGDRHDPGYWREWRKKMHSLSSESGQLMGWPIYKILDVDGKLIVVTPRLIPGKTRLAKGWGEIDAIEKSLFARLEEKGIRIGDHIQWGTCKGLPFLMDLSDLVFVPVGANR